MLKQLVHHSLQSKGIVLVFACILLIYGIYKSSHAKLDVFPDFVQPQAVIQTECPGLSPEQVETLVTRTVETAANGVSHLESVRSQSIQGLSIVTVVFDEGTDIFIARQMLTEQLTAVNERLPIGVKPPRLTPLTSATMDLLKIGVVSDKMQPWELRSFVDWTLKPRLRAVSGVAEVGVMGGEVRQFQIQIDPDRLAAHNVSLNQVLAAARTATGARGAGFIETSNQRVVLQSEGQALTEEEIGDVVITQQRGANLRLKDVGKVVIGAEPKFGDAYIQGRPGVLVKLLSQYGANTMEVTESVEEALKEMKTVFDTEGVQIYPAMHRPATFIETALHHVKRSLFIGALLVVAVLFLFLFNLRSAFISITAIPLSLLIAVIILDYFGITLNTITIGGLAIAIGEVVDDAIIDVENIFRRLRENHKAERPQSAIQVVFDASMEVRSAVVYATFVVVLVFVPVLTMSGLQGRMFAPLGIAYILAILASLLVALTVTPALSLLLLPKAAERGAHEPFFLVTLKKVYGRLIHHLAQWPRVIIGGALLMCMGAGMLLTRFGSEFLPEFREGHFVLQVTATPGMSLPEMMQLGQRIAKDLLENVKVDGQPVIATVEHQAGRAELGEDPWGPHRSELHVELKPDVPGKDQADVQEQIRDLLENYPGISSEVLTFLGDRISETVTGETAGVVINLFSDDLDALDLKAEEVAGVISALPGATDTRVASPPGAPQVVIQLKHDRLKQFGFQPVTVLEAIETAYQGTPVAQTYQGSKVFDVVVILDAKYRQDPESVGSLLLRSESGTLIRLDQLADVFSRNGRYMILHNGTRRRQAVTCNVEGRDIAAFVEEAREKVGKLSFPTGMYPVFEGVAETRKAAQQEILLHSALVGIGIVMLLSMVFKNLPNLLLVLANLPFALVGGVLAAYFTGGSLSIGSLVGFVTLFGITMRNSVMMVSHFDHLVNVEGVPWGLEAAVRGASERIIPVLMTALVTAFGLLPIALGTGEVGREIEGPMAVVILGGLITSTLLNLLILPPLSLWFGRFISHPKDDIKSL